MKLDNEILSAKVGLAPVLLLAQRIWGGGGGGSWHVLVLVGRRGLQ